MSSRSEKIRKRSEEEISESKKLRQQSAEKMNGKTSEETETSHPEINNLHLVEDAKQMMESLKIASIENIIATSMAKHMAEWQNTIMNTFAITCSNLVENAVKKTD